MERLLDFSKRPIPITENFLLWAVGEFEDATGREPEEIVLTGNQCRQLSRDVGQDLRLVELTPVLGNVAAFMDIPVTREVEGMIGRAQAA